MTVPDEAASGGDAVPFEPRDSVRIQVPDAGPVSLNDQIAHRPVDRAVVDELKAAMIREVDNHMTVPDEANPKPPEQRMTMSAERDELAQIIDDRWHGYGYNPQGAAQAILAAGWVKPRIIETDDDLFDLPVGTVLKDRDHDIVQRFRDGWRATINEDHDEPWLTDTLEVDLPATVLYEPAA